MEILTATKFKKEMVKRADKKDAVFLQRFFKTGKGQYGEGDKFLGVRVPAARKVCSTFAALELLEIKKLLYSPIHEHRWASVILLSARYKKGDDRSKLEIYNIYMKALKDGKINSWDIVDISCPHIVGAQNLKRPETLFQLAKGNLWERRVAVISTFWNIKNADIKTTFKIAEILLRDKQDLIHKASGWALREAGKKDKKALLVFLEKYAEIMPRVMLRYACEKLTPSERHHFYSKKYAAG